MFLEEIYGFKYLHEPRVVGQSKVFCFRHQQMSRILIMITRIYLYTIHPVLDDLDHLVSTYRCPVTVNV